jgi:hypothetical protein
MLQCINRNHIHKKSHPHSERPTAVTSHRSGALITATPAGIGTFPAEF